MIDLSAYQEKKMTIDLVKANIYGIVGILPIALLFGLPFWLIWDNISFSGLIDLFANLGWAGVLLPLAILATLIIGIVLHELIHGIVWAHYATQEFRSIKFGILWTMLTPYCHCKEPLRVKHYVMGAAMPGVVLGIIPAAVSIAIGSVPLLIFGIFFTLAAVGDLMVILLLRHESADTLVLDHPSEAGCFVYVPKEGGEDAE